MYYTACLLLTIQWQLLCQAIVSLVYKWEGLLKIVWGGCNPLNPPPRSAPAPDLRDAQTSLTISESEEIYTKTLGVEWHSVLDHFRLSIANHSPIENLTKRALVSDIAKTYDILGWYAPTIIKVKILLQKVWEAKIDWDDPVPQPIADEWELWRSQLKSLSRMHIPRCYFPKDVQVVSTQLHGFSDASESAYTLELSIYAW